MSETNNMAEPFESVVKLMELARKATISSEEITTCIQEGNYFAVHTILSRRLKLTAEQKTLLLHNENAQIRKVAIETLSNDSESMKVAIYDSLLENALVAALSNGANDEDRDFVWNRAKQELNTRALSVMAGSPSFRAENYVEDFYKALLEIEDKKELANSNEYNILTFSFLRNDSLPVEAIVRAAKTNKPCSRNARIHSRLPIAIASELVFSGVPEARAIFHARKDELIQHFIQEGIIDASMTTLPEEWLDKVLQL